VRFTFSESAKKDIKKLDKKTAKRLKDKFIFWQDADDALAFAKSLTQHVGATHRFRLGVYRILVRLEGQELRVLRIRHRKDVYKK